MKKIFTCSIACVLSVMFTVSVYATSISVKDAASDVVSVTGDATAHDQAVTLVVLNPGYDLGDYTENDYESQTDAIQYFDMVYPVNGKYSFDVPMYDSTDGIGGGNYRFVVTVGDERTYNDLYPFYFNNVKLSVIDTINLADEITTAMVEDAYQKYGLNIIDLYKNGNKSGIVTSLTTLKNNMSNHQFERDVNKFDLTLRHAALLSAYNSSSESLLVNDGVLLYADLLGVEEELFWEDYMDCIKESGKEKLHQNLIGKSYSNIEEISSYLRELVAYYGLTSNKVNGFGHMDTFFSNYEDVYTEYGFKLNKLTSKNKNTVYSKLSDVNTSDLSQLASKFNKFVGEKENDGGGSSGSSSSGGGTSFYPSAEGNLYITPEIGFDDIASVEWANTAIMTLVEKDVIKGKANRVFAPNDYVTRAEFLKMLLLALEITGSGSETEFSDVAGHWGKDYVSIAYQNGIAMGITENLFEPDGIITREMGAVFASRALKNRGVSPEKDSVIFADDTQISDYAKESVYSLKLAGIISGIGNNEFNPKGTMTRAEAAKMIYEVMIYSEGELRNE